ncbi:o-succinylbenzoate synthase [Fulvitalea axinellae]|uniref:O-succinylbenzoate synthase n=1 Tax=Fulvitalea axinellae TaxID=1182444 RepID=A0AAU9CGJ5_9BACT|nr:o-succinylbenzoate synthase [Fulvitalea axinellae]
MRIRSTIIPYTLAFKFAAGTSRGVLREKNTWFWVVEDLDSGLRGIGECGPLKGLSVDDRPDFGEVLEGLAERLAPELNRLCGSCQVAGFVREMVPDDLPSARFGLETALLDIFNGGKRTVLDSPFVRGERSVPINGLVWMGDEAFMSEQIERKITEGYTCVKMKIGAIDFDKELALLRSIRKRFGEEEITLRVDANGAFGERDVFEKLEKLGELALHSIEQPVMAGQYELMRKVCDLSPVDVALDEELIGVNGIERAELLDRLNPQYIILKPTLVGGLADSGDWISLAESRGIGWWMTSALESNVGLNAIGQYTDFLEVDMPQGLGTGQLYHNNIGSPLRIKRGELWYGDESEWKLETLIEG